MTFVAPNLAWGEARGASARAPGASPASGAVTDEQRSPRPNSAQPFGRRFFSAQAALLAPYRSTGGICSSLAPCLGRKLLAANVTGVTLMTTKAWHQYTIISTEFSLVFQIDGRVIYSGPGGVRFDAVHLYMSGPTWRPAFE